MANRFTGVFFTLILAAFTCAEGPFLSNCVADEKAPTADGVMKLILPEQTGPEIKSIQDRFYRLAMNQARYVQTLIHPWSEDPSMKLGTESKSVEHCIRPNTGAIATFAFLYRFGDYDEKVVGISRADLLEQYIVPMMRYIAATHVTGPRKTSDGKKWGNQWQSAYWAQMLGRSAWWIWDDLPEDLRQSVRRVVAHEAKRFVGKTPPHNLARDTKSEENAWNSMIFDMAMLLMPDNPERPVWEKEFQRWAMSSYLRPADEHSAKIVDGRPVSVQYLGPNVFDDFTLENHGMVHPDYMGAFSLTVCCITDFQLSNRRAPEALLHNVREIYANLKWFYLPDGGCVYPNGEDWDLFCNPYDWSEVHTLLAAYAQDPDALSLLKKCLATGEKMQARHPNGAIYEDVEIVYEGAQLLAGEAIGRGWLALETAKQVVDRPEPLQGVKRLDNGKLIMHRTPKAIHTLSWGPVVMAQCVPLRMDRLVSPDQRNGVGHVQLRNERKVLPVKLVSANVKDSADGFTADLVLDHGDAVRAELQFRSNADGSFAVKEKLTVLRDIETSEIATGMLGVLNNPKWIYESHSRKIMFGEKAVDVPCLSGETLEGDSVRWIDVDGALIVESSAPLAARYQGAKRIEDGRATDRLYLNYLGGERNWKSGEVISTYEATVSPTGKS